MKIGDALPAALWFNDDHPKDRADAVRGIKEALEMTAADAGVKLGPIQWDVVDPLSPRVPTPPDTFQGDIKCMIGEAIIVGHIKTDDKNFTDDLEPHDLERLRKSTRKQMGNANLTDEECDDFINDFGPDVAYDETVN